MISPSSKFDHCEPDIIELKDGRLLCLLRPNMSQSFSDDKGKTWSKHRELVPLTRGDAPFLLLTKEGVILCAYRERPRATTSVIISTDNAKTWSRPLMIDRFAGAYPKMVELDDGRIFCVYYGEGVGIKQAIFRVKTNPPAIELVD